MPKRFENVQQIGLTNLLVLVLLLTFYPIFLVIMLDRSSFRQIRAHLTR